MGFRCECKHLHSLVNVLRWREVEDPEYLVETPEVQQATVLRKGLNRTTVEVVRWWPLCSMQIVCEVAAAHFARESAFDQGHAKELTAFETKLFFSTRADARQSRCGEVSELRCLEGDCLKSDVEKFRVSSASCATSRCRFCCAGSISSRISCSATSLAVFRAVVQEIGQPSLHGNGRVAISKKQLSQLGIVMNRSTDHSTMKTCFKADEQRAFVEEALHQSAQRLRTAQRELSNSASNQATMR